MRNADPPRLLENRLRMRAVDQRLALSHLALPGAPSNKIVLCRRLTDPGV